MDEYAPIIGQPEVDELRALAASLRGHSIQMVNSTAVGGGVAEILTRLVPILQELDLSVRWDVITGGNEFLWDYQGIPQCSPRRTLLIAAGEF